jgi:hypothetical protein
VCAILSRLARTLGSTFFRRLVLKQRKEVRLKAETKTRRGIAANDGRSDIVVATSAAQLEALEALPAHQKLASPTSQQPVPHGPDRQAHDASAPKIWQASGVSCSGNIHAVLPNPSVNRTRYGSRRKPGVCHSNYRHTPGLRRLPPRAGYLER